jgi:hypothetical protein
VILGAVGQHDFLVGPIGVVCEQDGLAQLPAAETVQRRLVGREGEFQAAANFLDLGF